MTTRRKELLFHRLQKEGPKALRVFGANPEFELDVSPFIEKVTHSYKDDFPVFVLSLAQAAKINARFWQVKAQEGLSIEEARGQSDTVLDETLTIINAERLDTSLPSRRFGIELQDDVGSIHALVIEAVNYDPLTVETVPLTPEEAKGKKLKDCSYFHIHYLRPDMPRTSSGALPENGKISLDNSSVIYDIPVSLQTGCVALGSLRIWTDAFKVSTMPARYQHETSLSERDIFGVEPPESTKIYLDHIKILLEVTQNFLWVLERDPKLVSINKLDLKAANHLRRHRHLPAHSPFHIVEIDEEELRRLEFNREAEIADAMAHKGGYKIEGLVLVAGYDRKGTEKRVDDYARCHDDEIRRTANELLKEKNYKAIAQLVRDFGNRVAQQRLGSSPVYVPIVR